MTVRYIVDDVDAAIAFYTTHLGFEVVMHPAPPFAMLALGDLRLLLSAPSGQGRGDQVLLEDPSGNPVELFTSKSPDRVCSLSRIPPQTAQSICTGARCLAALVVGVRADRQPERGEAGGARSRSRRRSSSGGPG